jgi:hypothetical protein
MDASDSAPSGDKFVDMVSATAQVTLPLSEFQPQSSLTTEVHSVETPRFPAIDYHNHLDSMEPEDVLRIMDACGIERVVNITMKVGAEAHRILDRYRKASDRFSAIGWMDWGGFERADFVQLTVERLEQLMEHGAVAIKFWKDLGLTLRDGNGRMVRIDDERLEPVFAACRLCFTPPILRLFSIRSMRAMSATKNWPRIRSGDSVEVE